MTKQTSADRNIYQKLADAREQFHQLELKKTGRNKFAGYDYFELGDFLIPAMQCMKDNGLIPIVSFNAEYAEMQIHDMETMDAFITIRSPMAEAHLKGCHPIQNMGATETYSRRYLWVAAMEIVEHDALDGSPPLDQPQPKAKPSPKKTAKPAVPESEDEPEWIDDLVEPAEDDTSVFAEFEDEEGAKEVADMMIELASGMHAGSLKGLVDFWNKNKAVIDALDKDYPDQYVRVKKVFTKIRKQLQEKENG